MSDLVFGPHRSPVGRISYPYVWTPRESNDGKGKPRYSVSLILDPQDPMVKVIYDDCVAAAKEFFGSRWSGNHASFKEHWPIKNRDVETKIEGDPAFGKVVLSASVNVSGKPAPRLLDRNNKPIQNQTEIYGGMIGAIHVQAFPYETKGDGNNNLKIKGVKLWLNGLTKVADAAKFGNSDFEPPAIEYAVPEYLRSEVIQPAYVQHQTAPVYTQSDADSMMMRAVSGSHQNPSARVTRDDDPPF